MAVAALVTLAAMSGHVPSRAAEVSAAAGSESGCDALCVRVGSELANFTGWLRTNGAQGYVGEVGWPDDRGGDGPAWAGLAESWYRDADAAGLWVTSWATGEWWGTGYKLAPYEDRLAGAGVDTADVQAAVVERHASGAVRRGVNVAGAEFGAPQIEPTSSFSNRAPGAYDTAYHYDTQATFDYLAGRGVKLVRLPVRWERLQRAPFAPLDATEVARLRAALSRAGQAGLSVVVDVHNFGGYYLSDGTQGVRRAIGSSEVPITAFADLWSRISASVADVPSVAGYGLMNEPVNLPSLDGQAPARTWERASRAAVDAVRARGDRHLVLVPGYEWSGAQRWTQQHPVAWVNDPAGNVRYEAHHYWDADNSGRYGRSYAEEVTDARSRGYADAPPVSPAPAPAPPGADMAVWRPSNGTWYVRLSSTNFDDALVRQWGLNGDIPLTDTDFDGDAKADMAVWRPANGTWYVRLSSTNFDQTLVRQWGLDGDIPLTSTDFDGDAKADMAVWRPANGTWYVRLSSTNFDQTLVRQWGLDGDIPLTSIDFDGDAKADMAVWRPSNGTWYVRTSSSGFQTTAAFQWGLSGDIPLADTDFDGDKRADMAVWRPSNGTWYAKTSSSGFHDSLVRQWGLKGDIPLTSTDFDGDKRADMAVWRPANGTWYAKTSSSGFHDALVRQWGLSGDIPLAGTDFDG